MQTLNEIPFSKAVKIASIDDKELAGILFPMGCLVGETIEKIQSAPMGDPIMCRVGDHFISIRKSDAQHILVTDKN
ncbi:MAG TPA: ferrous iron transport protein A [Flavobacteriales bacterium]|nr:ferrous iron transport protein A [Flavobacteriales bacterium]|tara:strand:- start:37267 stop:37494 length:228 start_codon:yes stop_codon:yes gene_type:complete